MLGVGLRSRLVAGRAQMAVETYLMLPRIRHLAVRGRALRIRVRVLGEIVWRATSASHAWRRRRISMRGDHRSWSSRQLSLGHHSRLSLHKCILYGADQVV